MIDLWLEEPCDPLEMYEDGFYEDALRREEDYAELKLLNAE